MSGWQVALLCAGSFYAGVLLMALVAVALVAGAGRNRRRGGYVTPTASPYTNQATERIR